MRLSDAIRAGAKMKPHGVGSSTVVSTGEKVCALGAAACGAGIDTISSFAAYNILKNRFPILREEVRCESNPSKCRTGDVCEVIYHLNDGDGWSRERIADWVEQVEDEALECGLYTKEQLGYATE